MPKKKLKSGEVETIITARFIAPENDRDTMRVELNMKRGGIGRKYPKLVESFTGSLTKVHRKKNK